MGGRPKPDNYVEFVFTHKKGRPESALLGFSAKLGAKLSTRHSQRAQQAFAPEKPEHYFSNDELKTLYIRCDVPTPRAARDAGGSDRRSKAALFQQ